MVFGNYTKIVYLAQTEDAELQKKAKWAADYLGLDYEYRFTGYGDLTPAILQRRQQQLTQKRRIPLPCLSPGNWRPT